MRSARHAPRSLAPAQQAAAMDHAAAAGDARCMSSSRVAASEHHQQSRQNVPLVAASPAQRGSRHRTVNASRCMARGVLAATCAIKQTQAEPRSCGLDGRAITVSTEAGGTPLSGFLAAPKRKAARGRRSPRDERQGRMDRSWSPAVGTPSQGGGRAATRPGRSRFLADLDAYAAGPSSRRRRRRSPDERSRRSMVNPRLACDRRADASMPTSLAIRACGPSRLPPPLRSRPSTVDPAGGMAGRHYRARARTAATSSAKTSSRAGAPAQRRQRLFAGADQLMPRPAEVKHAPVGDDTRRACACSTGTPAPRSAPPSGSRLPMLDGPGDRPRESSDRLRPLSAARERATWRRAGGARPMT